MTILQKQFFALVRSGLWGNEADATLFDASTDWAKIYQSARKQALLGIVFDGVQTLPKEKQPPRNIYLQWCNAMLHIEENNRVLNRELANVYALMRENGIEPVLMKGQGVAQNYRYPLHRHCGDIDLYIGPENYEKANALLRKEVTSELEETYKHINVVWHGVTVENHRVLTQLSAPLADRRLQAEIKRWHGSDECRKRWIGDVEVTLAPLPFDTAFVLIHSVQHFLNEGIGLRQICDWACMLHAQRNLPGKEDIAHLLKSFGLEKAARVFGALAVCFLGLPQEDLPIAYRKKDIPTAEWLLNDIWQGGNFGHYDQERQNRPKGYWKGKWFTFTRAIGRCYELGALAPREACWYPFVLIKHSMEMQWKKRFSGNSSLPN